MIPANAEGIVHGRAIKKNANGGVTTGVATAGKGPEGGVGIRGHKVTTDGQGDATRTTAGAYKGANGSTFERKSTTNATDGNGASHQGGFTGTGPNGAKINSSGSYQRSAPGDGSGNRSTDVTGANGKSYQGSTSWNKGSGVQHSGTCRDASGNTIPCK
jgi:hypothetical protein